MPTAQPPGPPAQRKVNQARLPLALWDYGGEGPNVLFVHGFLDTGRSFEDIAFALKGTCRPLCLDWRGHGASAWAGTDAGNHQLDHLKDLVTVLDELAADGTSIDLVVAHSMGGTIAIMLAGFAPEIIPRLLLLDCVGGYAADAETQVDQMGEVVKHLRTQTRGFREFDSREQAESRVRQNNPGLSSVGSERMVRHYLDETADGKFRVRLDPSLRGPNPYRFPEEHWQEICSRVKARTEVLAPEGGYMSRIPELGDRLAKIQKCTRVDVPGVGHHVHVEAPEVVVAAVQRLLQQEA
ncbi:MAG: alpha/beta hydrolase [Planctomycetota bacterium]|nr:alpha/beta hydrolase [Planctomycetota bacterium]MDA1113563.1 alpha/beta hydrolase [Planctomycetota bacterium]